MAAMISPPSFVHADLGIAKRGSIGFPLEVILSWPKPNYVNPARRDSSVLYAVNSIFFFITLVCFTLRMYTRIRIRKWVGPDDLFLSLSIVGAIGVSACVMLGTHKYNWERHIYDIFPQNITPAGKILYASKILWSITSNSVRASVMCFYYRLMNHIGINKYRWVLHLNTVFIIGVFLTQQFTSIFTCIPIKAMWTWPQILTAKCIDNGKVMIAGAVLNTVSEFIVACLPLPVIAQLNLSPRQRTEVTALLCGGFLVVICGCVRTYYIWLSVETYDMAWWAMPHWITSEVEIDVAIICACAPVLRPMLGRAFSGGLSAALLPNNNENRRPKSESRARRAKSLFSKKTVSMTTYSTNTTRSLSLGNSHKDVDLEGIGNDGFGYCVTISTAHGTKVKKRWDIRNKVWHYYPEVKEEEDESIAPKSRRGSESRRRSDIDDIRGDSEKPTLEIQTERTVEVRESFCEDKLGRGWDVRNPYRKEQLPSKYEEDIEVAMQVPEAPLSDWSFLNDESHDNSLIVQDQQRIGDYQHSRRTSSQAVPPDPLRPRRPESAYASHRTSALKPRSSVDQIRPKTNADKAVLAHRVRRSEENIRGGILPSPSTIASNQGRKRSPSPPIRSMRDMPTPPALPPSGRFPRSVSPIVQPLNSSQEWATSPHVIGIQRALSHQKKSRQERAAVPEIQARPYKEEQPTPEIHANLQRRPSQPTRPWAGKGSMPAHETQINSYKEKKPGPEVTTNSKHQRRPSQQEKVRKERVPVPGPDTQINSYKERVPGPETQTNASLQRALPQQNRTCNEKAPVSETQAKQYHEKVPGGETQRTSSEEKVPELRIKTQSTKRADNLNGGIETAVANAWDQGRLQSYQSSINAQDRSSIAKATTVKPKQQPQDNDSSDDDFNLPLQRPSPRNSGQGMIRGKTPPPPVPKIKVGDYG